jgi:hypothetical protein
MEEGSVKEILQKLVQQNEGTATVANESVRKLAKHVVRIRCHNESDVIKIRQLKREILSGGAPIMKTEYGRAIHGVSKHLMENIEEFMASMAQIR